jgi:hypothetical protein
MIGLFCFVLAVLASPFKSKLRLEAENAVLRRQLIVLRRRPHGRVRRENRNPAVAGGVCWSFYKIGDVFLGGVLCPALHWRELQMLRRRQLHPVVLPHVSHFMHVPFRTRVKLPHSPHISPS